MDDQRSITLGLYYQKIEKGIYSFFVCFSVSMVSIGFKFSMKVQMTQTKFKTKFQLRQTIKTLKMFSSVIQDFFQNFHV